jgi:Protein of unknown function (DUF3108)
MVQEFCLHVQSQCHFLDVNKAYKSSVWRRMQCLYYLFFASILLQNLQAAPTWPAELTSPEPGVFPQLPHTQLNLRISWNGTISAGTVQMEFSPPGVKKAGTYVVTSSAASQGAAALLFPYQTNFWSEINPDTLRPKYFHALEKDDKESNETTVRHFPTYVDCTKIDQILKSGKLLKTNTRFDFTPVFDIFSAMLHVRSQKLANGDHITLVVHPFDTPYLLKINVIDRELHNGVNAIRLSVGMRKMDPKTLELRAYKKIKKDVTLWLSDDADRIPLELRAAAYIGDVRATLVSHRRL